MLNQIYVQVDGGYSLGVNTREEAFLAAYGDYSCIDGLGYPSIVGDFFETHSGESTWSTNYLSFEPEDIDETIEFLEVLVSQKIKIFNSLEDDVTVSFKSIIETALQDAKAWKERYNA